MIGEVYGSYRTQNFIKVLIDAHKKYNFYYNSIQMFSLNNNLSKYLHRYFKWIFELIFILNADLIYFPAMNKVGIKFIISSLLKKKIISDFYVSAYDSKVLDRKLVTPNSLKAKYYRWNDKTILEKSSFVIFLNYVEAKRYYNMVGLDEQNYSVIPLCIDSRKTGKLNYYKTKEELKICWWGTYIPLHGLEKIIASMKILREKGLKFKFYILGDSDEKSAVYQKQIEELNLQEWIYIENSYSFGNGKLENFLEENCDIAMGIFGDSEKAKNVTANKVIDACAMKIPIITGFSAALKEFFNNDSIYMVEEPTIENIAKTIIEVAKKDIQEVARNTESAYKIYQDNFSYEAYKTKILKLLDK